MASQGRVALVAADDSYNNDTCKNVVNRNQEFC